MNKKETEAYLIDGYLPTIGIECHVQLKTASKLFTAVASQTDLSQPANSAVGPLCLGLPGALPVVNQRALDLAVLAGLALEAEIARSTSFDRKHYFYPDLPLGYQISQHYFPIVGEGSLDVSLDGERAFQVRIERAHLEADAGKLTHQKDSDFSLLDLNRVGAPLLEIVSRPDMHTPQQAKQYARELYLRMVYVGVCDGDLSAGNLRFDVNVSVSRQPDKLGTRTEIKNLNSFRFIEQALGYEIRRQIDLLKKGETVEQETRGWQESSKKTFSQRSKEDAQDYRYMPDPDIPPFEIDAAVVDDLRRRLPATPGQIRRRFREWQIPFVSQEIILDHRQLADCLYGWQPALRPPTAQLLTKWLVGDILALVNKKVVDWPDVIAVKDQLKELADLSLGGKINSATVKEWLPPVVQDEARPADLLAKLKPLPAAGPEALETLVKEVFEKFPQAVADARKDPKATGFLIGQAMKLSQKQADPRQLAELVGRLLKEPKP